MNYQQIELSLDKMFSELQLPSPDDLKKVSHSEDYTSEWDYRLAQKIKEALQFTGIPVYVEEELTPETQSSSDMYFLVDPIDGSKHFMKRDGLCGSSVGLIDPHNHKVVWGYVISLLENRKITMSRETKTPRILLVSQTEYKKGLFNRLLPLLQKIHLEVLPIGSAAIKMAMAATDSQYLYLSLEPKNSWDIAGGIGLSPQLHVTDLSGQPLVFDHKPHKRWNGIIAGPIEWVQKIQKLL